MKILNGILELAGVCFRKYFDKVSKSFRSDFCLFFLFYIISGEPCYEREKPVLPTVQCSK